MDSKMQCFGPNDSFDYLPDAGHIYDIQMLNTTCGKIDRGNGSEESEGLGIDKKWIKGYVQFSKFCNEDDQELRM
ncbi:hypothetical protein LXL04_011183 [Taraxacum kok-saghyz]